MGDLFNWGDGPTDIYERAGVHASRILLGLRCLGPTSCQATGRPGSGEQLRIHASRLTFEDRVAPQFERDPSIQADRVVLSASDRGAGVSEFQFRVDGNLAGQISAAGESPSCHVPFVDPVPCPLPFDAVLPLATDTLLDGGHELRAEAIDAAEGSPLIPPSPVLAKLTGFARLTAWFSGRSRAVQRTLRFGERVAVEGVLTDRFEARVPKQTGFPYLEVASRTVTVRGRP